VKIYQEDVFVTFENASVAEARLEDRGGVLAPDTQGRFVVNVRDSSWLAKEVTGDCCGFEGGVVEFLELGFTVAGSRFRKHEVVYPRSRRRAPDDEGRRGVRDVPEAGAAQAGLRGVAVVFPELVAIGFVAGFAAGLLLRRFLFSALPGVAAWIVLTIVLIALDVHDRESGPAFAAYAYFFSLIGWLAGAQIGAHLRQPRAKDT
jgi:hypothetical protein